MKKQDKEYLIDGIKYPRITSILDETSSNFGLVVWFRNTAHPCKTCMSNGSCGIQEEALERWDKDISAFSCLCYNGRGLGEQAADYGTAVHDQLFQYFTGNQIEKSDKNPFWISIKPVIEWADKNKIEPMVMEEVVYSKTFGYAGRLDFLAKVNGKIAIIDWKTSKELRWNYVVQASAYWNAWNELHPGQMAEEIYIVRCPKISNPNELDPDKPQEAEILPIPINKAAVAFDEFTTRLKQYNQQSVCRTPKKLKEWLEVLYAKKSDI